MAYIERPRFSCSLGGALEVITSLKRTIPIIHASSGCGGTAFGSQQGGGGYYGAGYCGGLSIPSSNISENEIVFGGEKRLEEQIKTTLEILDGDLYVVVTGCMTEIIGDDVKSVANLYSGNDKPVLSVETGGFRGNSYKGYDIVFKTLFTEYTEKTDKKEKNLVNLFGLIPSQDVFFRGDLEEIKRLLNEIGINANTFFGYDESLKELKEAGKASLNIVFSNVYGVEAAGSFKEKHGTPFITTDIPVGPTATEKFLYKIADLLDIDKERVHQVIVNEKSHYYTYIERAADLYTDADFQHYFVVVSNSNYVYPVTKFISDDIGWIPLLSVVTDNLQEEQKESIIKNFKDFEYSKPPELVFETNTSDIIKHFTDNYSYFKDSRYLNAPSPIFIFGSSLEKDFADGLNAKLLTVSFPVLNRAVLHKGYAGFRGGLNLFEDILGVILTGR
jgi:nitrogenase molybdenum-iron protein beta chain